MDIRVIDHPRNGGWVAYRTNGQLIELIDGVDGQLNTMMFSKQPWEVSQTMFARDASNQAIGR